MEDTKIDIEQSVKAVSPFFTKRNTLIVLAVMFVAGFIINWTWLATFGLTALFSIGLMTILHNVVKLPHLNASAIATLSVVIFVSWWSGANFAFFAGSIIGAIAWWHLLKQETTDESPAVETSAEATTD